MAYTTINKSTDYFNNKLYTGTGSSQNITGVGFQPDFTWLKSRSNTDYHALQDAVRGVTKQLATNTTGTQTSYTNGVTAFGTDGFTVDSANWSNRNSGTFASWNWKAGTTSGIATNGATTITPASYSFNQTSGMSIINYDGNNTAGAKVAHGLGATPDMMIVKAMNSTAHWAVYHKDIGNTHYFQFDTNAKLDDAGVWNDTSPDSVNFTVGNSDKTNTVTYIAYCFSEKVGYSKFGKYVGNGNTDGAFIYTGFKPAFVIRKRTSGTGKWIVQDSKRPSSQPFNEKRGELYADDSATESSSQYYVMDFLSNGFKNRSVDSEVNGSGSSYIYMAFAEAPLVGSNNVPCTAR